MSLFPINKILYMLFIVQCVFDWDRIKESLASLLISEQELLYAVKVELIVSLFNKPSSNIICKECMAYNSPPAAAILQFLTARSIFPDFASMIPTLFLASTCPAIAAAS